jgi:1,4-dihydroxy-2-naphthoate polyprenyltransferase
MHPQPLSNLQIWLMASRPRTLPAAASPVIVAIAIAIHDGVFQPLPALAALLAALLLQVGANLANDVFDYLRGVDTSHRLGPTRVTQAGLLTPRQVLAGMWLVFGLAGLLGAYLIWVAGWPVLVIGLASILAAVAYSGGPLPFGYYGLGDLVVFLFFGPVAVAGAYFIQAGSVSLEALLASIPMGLLTTAILVVNNLRDIETDHLTGKRTLAVRLGAAGTRREFGLCLALAYLAPLLFALLGAGAWWGLLAWLSIPYALRLRRMVYTQTGKPLNLALAASGQLELLYGVLYGLGWVLARLI